MSIEFWVWLGVIIVTAVMEATTMDLVSVWFTIGALIPFILSATGVVGWEINLVIFIVVSAVLMICLRKVTKKFLLRNSNEKTNLASLVGQKYRMLTRTDFETLGSVKVNDITWTAVGDKRQEIEAGAVVEIVSVQGNKMVVKAVEEEKKELAVKEVKKKTPQKNTKFENRTSRNKLTTTKASTKTTTKNKTNKGENK